MTDADNFDLLVSIAAKRYYNKADYFYISHTERRSQSFLPWSYASNVLDHIQSVNTMLDMDTRDGKFLSKLAPLPLKTTATERYDEFAVLAKKQLDPLGVKVHLIHDATEMPFSNDVFDLIINHHGSYCSSEVYRILKPGGLFITQQIGDRNELDLNNYFESSDFEPGEGCWNLDLAVSELEGSNFKLQIKEEAFPIARYYDVGAVIYQLKMIPWQFPEFSVEKYKKVLRGIHENIKKDGFIESTCHRFFIIAKK